MALIGRRIVFLHVPKCGGVFVRHALKAISVPCVESAHPATPDVNHHNRDTVSDHLPGRFSFCFVRNPLTWYQSFWAYRMIAGLRPGSTPWDEFLPNPFEPFVRSCTKHLPGSVTTLFASYTGWPVAVDFVGRQETLAEDLIDALVTAGVEFDPDIIRKMQPTNTAASRPQWQALCEYTRRLKGRVYKAEKDAFVRYGYEV